MSARRWEGVIPNTPPTCGNSLRTILHMCMMTRYHRQHCTHQRLGDAMETDRTAFMLWLRASAAAAGYDPGVRGRIAALAKAAGVDAAPVSRALSGEMVPKIDTQRALAKALKVEPLEMYVRSGTIKAEDVPDGHLLLSEPATGTTVEAIAEKWGVPAGRRDLLLDIFEAVAETVAKEDNNSAAS